jgi:cytidylate kinase
LFYVKWDIPEETIGYRKTIALSWLLTQKREVDMAVITISRQFGAGGRTLGKKIARQLGYRFLDDRIIQALAEKAGVSTDFIKSIERTSGSALSKLLSGIVSRSYMERILGSERGYVNEEIYVELLQEVMTTFAKEGDVVLLGRGGQYILQDFEDSFHILLVSDLPHQVRFMQQFYDLSDTKAAKAVKQGAARRSNLYKKLHHRNYNDPHMYHLVLNTAKLSLDNTVQTVVEAVQQIGKE